MVHPMYGIDKQLARFPLFGKALEKTESEIEGALFWTIGEMGVICLPGKIIETADKTIDGTDAEKQAVMIGALYLLSPSATATDTGRFAAEYDAETARVLNEVAVYDRSKPATEKVAQSAIVLGVNLLTAMAPMLNGAQLPPEKVRDVREGMAQEEKLLLADLNAPRLEALYRDTVQGYLDRLEGAPPAQARTRPRAPGF